MKGLNPKGQKDSTSREKGSRRAGTLSSWLKEESQASATPSMESELLLRAESMDL